MKINRIHGLVAATVTPLHKDGSLNLAAVPPYVEHLLSAGVSGLYVCGSTGGGVSMTDDERRKTAAAFIDAVAGRTTVIVQVGHNSLEAAAALARQAADDGADVISATCPSYFKIDSAATLVDSMVTIAQGAPELPFYYYHIPVLTDVRLNMTDFLTLGGERIPNLVGIKFTESLLHEYQRCVEFDGGKYDILWGSDEMMIGALATGARGAIGSTFNIAAPVYHELISAFNEGNLIEARRLQSQANQMIRTLGEYPFHSALRVALKFLGFDCGSCRLPQLSLSSQDERELKEKLTEIGFFEYAAQPSAAKADRQLRKDGPASAPATSPRGGKTASDSRHERV